MKDVGYGVGSILSECKRIENVFLRNTEIAEDNSRSLMLVLLTSIYSKTAATETSSMGYMVFTHEQVELGV